MFKQLLVMLASVACIAFGSVLVAQAEESPYAAQRGVVQGPLEVVVGEYEFADDCSSVTIDTRLRADGGVVDVPLTAVLVDGISKTPSNGVFTVPLSPEKCSVKLHFEWKCGPCGGIKSADRFVGWHVATPAPTSTPSRPAPTTPIPTVTVPEKPTPSPSRPNPPTTPIPSVSVPERPAPMPTVTVPEVPVPTALSTKTQGVVPRPLADTGGVGS